MTVTLVRLHTLATSRLKGDRGQGSLEYIGILLVIAVVVGALVTAIDGLALDGRIGDALASMFP